VPKNIQLRVVEKKKVNAKRHSSLSDNPAKITYFILKNINSGVKKLIQWRVVKTG
jgi:hypothetical protein